MPENIAQIKSRLQERNVRGPQSLEALMTFTSK